MGKDDEDFKPKMYNSVGEAWLDEFKTHPNTFAMPSSIFVAFGLILKDGIAHDERFDILLHLSSFYWMWAVKNWVSLYENEVDVADVF